jgi:sulfide:quinone oxidoreductase
VSEQSIPASKPTSVLIAGGGFAALETALGLKALAEDRVRLTLVSPNPNVMHRPTATVEAFSDAAPVTYDLIAIAADLGATYHRAVLEAVEPERQFVALDSRQRLEYDVLVLAIGARAKVAIPGALTFRDQRDVPRFRVVLGELAAGAIRRLVFAVPSRDAWSLPVYELALLSAAHAAKHSVAVEIVVVTPEAAPLAVFGTQASRLVGEVLAERAIRFVGGSLPRGVRPDGSLALRFDLPVEADRVVAVPELRGPGIKGILANRSGFVPTDRDGRVTGLSHVYAAGDMTTFPIKQGGLAAQQADMVAHTIAETLGAPVKELHQSRILQARLLHGGGAVVLRTDLDALGRPTGMMIEHRESRRAEDLKVFGRYLTPYLANYRSRHKARVRDPVT